jgi:hypothetical protein
LCDAAFNTSWDPDTNKCICDFKDYEFDERHAECIHKDKINDILNNDVSACNGSGGRWIGGECDCGGMQNVGGICHSPVSEEFCQTMHGSYENDKCMCGGIEMFDIAKDCVDGVITDKRYNLTLPPIPNNLTLSPISRIF